MITYDILRTNTPGSYFKNNPNASYVWCIDPQFLINEHIEWFPAFDDIGVFIFKLPGQMVHKYPPNIIDPHDNRCGGIKLFANNDSTNRKYIDDTPVNSASFPLFVTLDPTQVSTDAEFFWCIDPDFEFIGVPTWIPDVFDRDKINIFKVSGYLEERYLPNITDPCDNRCGGIKLYPNNWYNAPSKYNPDNPISFLLSPNEYYKGIYDTKLSYYKNDLVFFNNLLYQATKHVVCGNDFNSKFWSKQQYIKENFEKFYTYEEGYSKSKHLWFWVIDTNFDTNFEFDYIPSIHDKKFTHVWQKVNPKTGIVYDNCGIALYHKNSQHIKYMKKTEIVYPIYHVPTEAHRISLQSFYEQCSFDTIADMYYVVDTHTHVHSDFNFDYYPPHYDKLYVHVFGNVDGECKNVRLIPRELFINTFHTDEQIINNGFDNIKLLPDVTAFDSSTWPIHKLNEKYTKEKFNEIIAQTDSQFVFIVDADADIVDDFDFGFMPDQYNINSVHVWNSKNPINGLEYGYGGLKLFPTDKDYSKLTSDDIRLNRIEDLQYIDEIGSTMRPYDIFFLSYYEKNADEQFEELKKKAPIQSAICHIKNKKGIFEAHKECAKKASTNMFWVVDADADIVDDFDFGFMPDQYNINSVHVWNSKNPINGLEYGYGGLKLFPTDKDYSKLTSDDIRLNRIEDLQYIDEIGSTMRPYDIFFLSYYEKNADEQFEELKKKAPIQSAICHIKNKKGIFEAHKECAKKASTNMFWVVDADADIVDDFDFGFMPDQYNINSVHVWNSKNPINGLEYGYGGLKLFPTDKIKSATNWGLDFATELSEQFIIKPEISCITRFNIGPFETWRSAFRECTKLLLTNTNESKQRFFIWAHGTESKGNYCQKAKQGALAAEIFVSRHKNNIKELERINDYEWLRDYYADNMG